MLTATGSRRLNAPRTVLLLALALGLWAAGAAPADAIVGGREADHTYGQVQFYVTSGEEGDTGSYVCAGTLISPKWVLTAKHCIEDTGADETNSFILAGDTRLRYGTAHPIQEIHLNADADAALLELKDEADGEVVGYAASDPELNSLVDVAGWGADGINPPSETLQVATMEIIDLDWIGAEVGDRLLLEDIGQGFTEEGDSGAGVHLQGTGLIYGVLRGEALVEVEEEEEEREGAAAVPTSDIAGWIQDTSGVGPTGGDPMDVDSDEGGGGCVNSPTLPAENTSPEGTRDIDGQGRGQSGADVGNAIANVIEDVENADENVKALVGRLAQANPACNVMVIQQETYGEPVDISGVKEQSTVVFGTNTFDVWVFDSGTFTNDGDMGWDNWGWSGTWTRSEDQRTVTFEPIG